MVHQYEDDASFPAGLNGRFHGLLADRGRETVTLFNDRYGMQRLYYHQSKDAFYFAAEAKAIIAVRPELRRLDSRGLGEFVACGAVMENRTLFDGIEALPPGSAWVFRDRALESRDSYFRPQEWENQESLDPESYYRELRQAYSQNLPRYFDGQERIAMSLTGGLDTRMIMAWQKCSPVRFPVTPSVECIVIVRMSLSRQVAARATRPHQVITAGNEFLIGFPYYAERAVYLTDGCVDISRSPDVYLNEKARAIAPVRMTGNLGERCFERSVRLSRWSRWRACSSPIFFVTFM